MFNISLGIILLCLLSCFSPVVGRVKPYDHVENGRLVKKTLTGNDKWDAVIGAFRETIIRGFLQADAMKVTALLAGHPIGIATIWLLTIIKAKNGKGDSEWDKMEEKLTRKIYGSIDDNNLEDRARDLNRVTFLMGKARHSSFGKDDLNEIRSFLPRFFPQQYTAGKFNPKWMTLLTKYLAILNACYIDLMKQNVYDKCEWADQLRNLKPLVLTAAKKLAKSRYQDLEKVNWFGGVTIFKPTAKLQFKDKATGHDYGEVPLMQLKSRVFTPLEEETESFLMENLINQFNLLFNETWTPQECNPPSEISEGDLDIKFPRKCMDASGTCTFPCGYYTYKNKWCVKFKNHRVTKNKWETPSGGSSVTYTPGEDHWFNNCKFPDWDTCMSTPPPPLIEWTAEDYNKRREIWESNAQPINQTEMIKEKEKDEVKEEPSQKLTNESFKEKETEDLGEESPTPINASKATQQLIRRVKTHKRVKAQKRMPTQNKIYSQNGQMPYYYYNVRVE